MIKELVNKRFRLETTLSLPIERDDGTLIVCLVDKNGWEFNYTARCKSPELTYVECFHHDKYVGDASFSDSDMAMFAYFTNVSKDSFVRKPICTCGLDIAMKHGAAGGLHSDWCDCYIKGE